MHAKTGRATLSAVSIVQNLASKKVFRKDFPSIKARVCGKCFTSTIEHRWKYLGRFGQGEVLLCLQEWGAAGDHEVLPTQSTVAAQHALAESRQRRDERSLDKGVGELVLLEGLGAWQVSQVAKSSVPR